jgi:hypothetical protein
MASRAGSFGNGTSPAEVSTAPVFPSLESSDIAPSQQRLEAWIFSRCTMSGQQPQTPSLTLCLWRARRASP